ncbi:MAG: hypothetical protein DRP51_04240, partial [Candidatus Zixiibacteriota bacterium]
MLLNRKLIIAVLTIGLMLSFSSAAIGYDDTKLKSPTPIVTNNPNAPLAGEELRSYRNFSDVAKPTTGFDVPAGTLEIPGVRQCEDIDYTGGSFAYGYMLPSSYDNVEFGNKFTATYACTLNAIGIAHYGAWMEGTPDVEVTLWSGNGSGYPVTAIKSWVFPYASLSSAPQYLSVDLTADAGYPTDYMFATGDEFFVTANATSGQIGVLAGDIADPPYDENAEVGVTLYDNGVDPPEWRTMGDDGWGGWPPRAFLAYANVCYEEGSLSGDCRWQSYNCGAAYIWDISPDVGADYSQADAMAVRFTAAVPESLKYIDIAFYYAIDDIGDGTGVFPTAEVLVCPEGTGGEPDVASAYETFTVDYADMAWYTTIDVVDELGYAPVMTSDFFVVVRILGGGTGHQAIALLSDDGATCSSLNLRSWADYTTEYAAPWATMFDLFGDDLNLLIDVNTCQDVYTTCGWDFPYIGYTYFWRIPDYMDDPLTMLMHGWGVSYAPAFAGCDLGNIDIWFYGGAMAEDAEVAIYDATGTDGLPGNRLQYIPITGGSWPGGSFTLAPNLFFESKIWVVLESFATGLDDIQIITDDGTAPTGRNAILWTDEVEATTQWTYMGNLYGTDYNAVFDIYRCCYPFVVRTCAPDGDWPTLGKDFARTQSTLNEMGDIKCNLTKSWTYLNPVGNGVTFAQPIIADGKVFAYMFNALVCVDVNTGVELWRRDVNFAEIGGSCRATPTYHDGAVYVGGGDNGYFAKFDAATGATLWSHVSYGHEQYGPNVIMDIDGTECVVYADGLGNVYARNTATGDNYHNPGTGAPFFTATGQVHKGLTTDGTYLYIGCDEYLTTPNLFCVDPTDGSVVWNLVDDGPGWQLPTISGGWTHEENSQEGIYDAILYSDEGADGQWLYFVGRFQPQNMSPVHNGGIIYGLSADGTTLRWASECNGGGASAAGGILNDKAQVIYGGWSYWIEGGQYYGPMAFAKSTGIPQWGPRDYEPNYGIQEIPDPFGHVSQPGVLTCETFADPADND